MKVSRDLVRDLTVLRQVFAEPDAVPDPAEQLGELSLALDQQQAAQVQTVEFDQVRRRSGPARGR